MLLFPLDVPFSKTKMPINYVDDRLTIINKSLMSFANAGVVYANEHIPFLKSLLLESIIQGRHGEAQEILSALEKTTVSKDTLFLFRCGLSIVMNNRFYDTSGLRFFHKFMQTFKGRGVEILGTCTKYYIKHNRLLEAYDNLIGYLNSAPFSTSAFLHGLAGKVAATIAQRESRSSLKEKFTKRSCTHYASWMELVQEGLLEGLDNFDENLHCYLSTLNATNALYSDVHRIICSFLDRFHYHLKCYSLLAEYIFKQNDRIIINSLHYFEAYVEISSLLGVTVAKIIADLVLSQLRDRKMKSLEEFCKWLRLRTLILISEGNSNISARPFLLPQLEDCKFQFKFCDRLGYWYELIGSYPRASWLYYLLHTT